MLTEGNRNSDLGGEWSIEWTGGALKTNGFEGSKFLKFAHDSHVGIVQMDFRFCYAT